MHQLNVFNFPVDLNVSFLVPVLEQFNVLKDKLLNLFSSEQTLVQVTPVTPALCGEPMVESNRYAPSTDESHVNLRDYMQPKEIKQEMKNLKKIKEEYNGIVREIFISESASPKQHSRCSFRSSSSVHMCRSCTSIGRSNSLSGIPRFNQVRVLSISIHRQYANFYSLKIIATRREDIEVMLGKDALQNKAHTERTFSEVRMPSTNLGI